LPNITGNPTFSISFWVNPTSTGTPIMLGNASNGAAFVTFITSSNKLNFGRYGDTLGDSTASVPNNTWTHIAISNNAGSVQLYINGTADLSFSTTYNIGSNNLYLFTALTGQVLQGKLDQFRFFQKALSSSEVSTLYAETTPESLDPLSEDTTDTLQVLGDSSCVATYRFENDETDLSGNYDATGAAIQYAAGRYGQAASFNGSGSYIDIESQSLIQNNIESFSFWFKNKFVLGFYDPSSASSTDRRRWFIDNTTNGSIKIQVNNDQYNYEQTGITEDSNWHHLAVVSDGYIYLDGTALSSTFNTSYWITDGTNGTTRDTIRIGSSDYIGDADSGFSEGLMDQVRLFNKAISASEVTTLYQENSLVASYRFEGNANDDMRAYDGTASNVTYEYGLGFTPDFVWIKERTKIENHRWFDTTRGATKFLGSNNTNAEATGAATLTSFDTGGFTLGLDNEVNDTGIPYVAWCLKANGGTTASGSGTGGVSNVTTQVNSQAGFSIINFTEGTGTSSSVNHGLDATPDLIITRRRTMGGAWMVWHNALSGSQYLRLNETNAVASSTNVWNGTAPNATSVSLGPWLTESDDYGPQKRIMYAFHSVDSFSSFGSYTGNGSEQLVETGFEPAFVITKSTSATGHWRMYDNKRGSTDSSSSYVGNRKVLYGDLNLAEGAGINEIRFLSNGFEVGPGNNTNTNGVSFIYMAFAADPDTEAPTVAKSFSTVAYTGTQATLSIDSLGFKAGLIWLKNRDITGYNHFFYDIVRGPGKAINTNFNVAEYSLTGVSSFDDDGFTLGSNYETNRSGDNHIAWVWKADDNEPTINTEGSIDSIVSANANAGFSIVSYTGNGTAGATVGHGLSAAPEMIIAKSTSDAYEWKIWHKDLSSGYQILFNTAAQASDSSVWTTTTPTSTVFSVGTNVGVNQSTKDYIAYCFHSVSGYSKIGSYSGSSSTVSVNVGFQPDFVMVKMYNVNGGRWIMIDSVRGDGGLNSAKYVQAQDSAAETTNSVYGLEFTSTGFDAYNGTINLNSSGYNYIYMAFKIN
jgi:hypothetical protein